MKVSASDVLIDGHQDECIFVKNRIGTLEPVVNQGYQSFRRDDKKRIEYFASHKLVEKINRDGNEHPYGSQGLANCLRQNVELKRQNLIPIWVLEAEAKHFDDVTQNDRKVCVYEHFFHLQVDHSEKPYLLLESIADKLSTKSAFAPFTIDEDDVYWARIANLDKELQIIRDHLNKYIKPPESNSQSPKFKLGETQYQMTLPGWDELRKRNLGVKSKRVFVAMAFKWPNREGERENTLTAIKNACKSQGYIADLVDQGTTGWITDQIISDIKKAAFTVAELTYNNRGVYFESGFARGLGQNVFHLVEREQLSAPKGSELALHFDVLQLNYRTWVNPEDIENTLSNWIGASIGRYGETK